MSEDAKSTRRMQREVTDIESGSDLWTVYVIGIWILTSAAYGLWMMGWRSFEATVVTIAFMLVNLVAVGVFNYVR